MLEPLIISVSYKCGRVLVTQCMGNDDTLRRVLVTQCMGNDDTREGIGYTVYG